MTSNERSATVARNSGRGGAWRLWPGIDQPSRRRAINVGHLLSGNGVTAALGMIGIAITARSLGPASYGILALIVSYVRLFDRLMRFESWQPLIKYAVAPAAGDDPQERLRDLFAFGFRLDLAACAAATASAVLFAVAVGRLIGLEPAYFSLILIYCATLLFNISGTPTAILRLAGRFRTIAYIQVVGSVARIALCGAAAWIDGGLLWFVIAWTASQIISSLLFLAVALLELRRQGVLRLRKAPFRGVTDRFPGIMGFAWSSSLSMSVRSSSMELDVLIVGALANAESAGLYFAAKQIAKMVQQVCGQVQAVLYPDVARLWAERSYALFRRAVTHTQWALDFFIITAIAVFALFGRDLIRLVIGVRFEAAAPLFLVQLVALLFTVHAAPLRSALLAMGQQRSVLVIVLISTCIFHGLALTLVPVMGAMGANVAHVGLAAVSAVLMEYRQRLGLRSVHQESAPPPVSD